MPTTFSHDLFGKEVYQELPEEIKKIIHCGKSLYLIGLHGPDILFYHKPYRKNNISDVGYQMHSEIAAPFFQNAASVYKNNPNPLLASYLMGFVCHYILDSTCHPYVSNYEAQYGVSHAAIETEMDRFYKIREGKNPYSYRPQSSICITPKACEVISSVLTPLSADDIHSALKGMKFYVGLLVSRNALKRGLLLGALKIAGCYKSLQGQVMRKKPLPVCDCSTRNLQLLFEQAKPDAVKAIINLWNVLQDDDSLSDRFLHSYE